MQLGTLIVLEQNFQLWSELWQADMGAQWDIDRRCNRGKEWCRIQEIASEITPAKLRQAAMFLSPTTACTDGVPIRRYGSMSDEALEGFHYSASLSYLKEPYKAL